MTLFKVALQNDLSPSKNSKILFNIANHGYTMIHARPVTSKDRVAYQINGNTTKSKKEKMNKNDI